MAETTIKKMLKEFGLTNTESEIYLFLSKHGTSKGTEIAKAMGIDKSQIYHSLKRLSAKGLVENTLESPIRYTPVAFDSILESAIKAKKEEAARIQNTKQELVDYWKNLNKQKAELPLEKFLVIEGRQRIYAKISELVQNAQKQVSTLATVSNLLKVNESGIYDSILKKPSKANMQFRFLTSLFDQNIKSFSKLQNIWTKNSLHSEFRAPDLGQKLFPEMVIADNNETVFFIAKDPQNIQKTDELCLWTNSKSLTQAFGLIFEDLWTNATNLQEQTKEKTAKTKAKSYVIYDQMEAERKYQEALCSAKNEIILSTSSKGLLEFGMFALKSLQERSVSARIMLPLTNANLKEVQDMSKLAYVRHIQPGYVDTTIIDRTHLFQFTHSLTEQKNENIKDSLCFKDVFYSNDLEYVKKIMVQLENIWANAKTPSTLTLEALNKMAMPDEPEYFDAIAVTRKKVTGPKVIENEPKTKTTDTDFLNKIINPDKYHDIDKSDIVSTYGFAGQAIINLPSEFGLPSLLFHFQHLDENSTFGTEDFLLIHLWLETPAGYSYIPSAFITNNPKAVDFWKKFLKGIPTEQNINLVEKSELQIRVYGSSAFAVWTRPILIPPFTLPPCCLLAESVGKTKPGLHTIVTPSGYQEKASFNASDAFITFIYPSSKYSGPGTDGIFARDNVMEFYPPKK